MTKKSTNFFNIEIQKFRFDQKFAIWAVPGDIAFWLPFQAYALEMVPLVGAENVLALDHVQIVCVLFAIAILV